MEWPLLCLAIFLLLSSSHPLVASDDRLSPGESMSLNETTVSDGGAFALGFFPLGSKRNKRIIIIAAVLLSGAILLTILTYLAWNFRDKIRGIWKDGKDKGWPLDDLSLSTDFPKDLSISSGYGKPGHGPRLPLINFESIAVATNNFSDSHKLGQGGFGKVYKAWELWKEGRAKDVVDISLLESCSPDEVLRCILVGLLCVQDHSNDRPTMSSVVSMLENETTINLIPRQPTFTIGRKLDECDARMQNIEIFSANNLTNTMAEGR